MPLEMRELCERCQESLSPAGDAYICSYECTYCSACTSQLAGLCPNCTGELTARPRRVAVERRTEAKRPPAHVVQHEACVSWQRGGAVFTDNRYSRRHSWSFDGGAQVVASSSPHVVKVPMSDASAVDPEEAFVAALASCHMLWFLGLAAQAGVLVDGYVDSASSGMSTLPDGRQVLGPIVLRPQVTLAAGQGDLHEKLAVLHHAAHEQCFLASTLRYPLRVEATLG